MKKLFILAVAALMMAACSVFNSPSNVAEKFSVAVAHGKTEEAKKYCTEGTGKVLDLAAAFGVEKVDPNYKFHFLRDSIVENVAYVFYTENESTIEKSMTLAKIDGEWKVNIDSKK